jgi:hypothetical protein
MGELDSLWFSRYEKRNLWRDRAMESYIDSLNDNEVKELVRSSMKGTVPVSLYGKSQVGKTTFLLELMGIKKEHLETIHDILRCGTKPGDPATPTAMIYKRTSEEEFKVHYRTQVFSFSSEEEIRAELTTLRKKVEDGSFRQLDEIVVEIPERYFEDNSKLDIQVCDLPGIESSNEHERPHVEQIIKKFIPLSALILVFQNGSEINSVSDLFNNGVMSEIYGWKYMTKRYRLIVTRAFTAASVVREINANDFGTEKNQIIALYRREANMDANNPENVPEDVKIFPLELGKSLQEIPDKYDEGRQSIVNSVMSDLWSDIRNDIKQTAESGNIVQRLNEFPHLLKKLISDKYKEKSKLTDGFQQEIEGKETEKSSLIRNNEISREKIAEIKEEILRLSEIETIKSFGQYSGEKIRDEMIGFIDQTVRYFREKVNKVHESINIKEKEKWNDETHTLFTGIRYEISKIVKNRGFLFLGPDQWHVNNLNDRVSDLNNRINDIYNERIKNIIETKINEGKTKKNNLKNIVTANSNQLESLEKDVFELNMIRESVIGLISKKIESYQAEIAKGNNLIDFMRSEVQNEKNSVFNSLDSKLPVETFLDLAYTTLIIREYQKHIIHC